MADMVKMVRLGFRQILRHAIFMSIDIIFYLVKVYLFEKPMSESQGHGGLF
jgi:hypothetical protein